MRNTKQARKKQSKETKHSSDSGTDRTQMLAFSGGEFRITMTSILNVLMRKVDNIKDQMDENYKK